MGPDDSWGNLGPYGWYTVPNDSNNDGIPESTTGKYDLDGDGTADMTATWSMEPGHPVYVEEIIPGYDGRLSEVLVEPSYSHPDGFYGNGPSVSYDIIPPVEFGADYLGPDSGSFDPGPSIFDSSPTDSGHHADDPGHGSPDAGFGW